MGIYNHWHHTPRNFVEVIWEPLRSVDYLINVPVLYTAYCTPSSNSYLVHHTWDPSRPGSWGCWGLRPEDPTSPTALHNDQCPYGKSWYWWWLFDVATGMWVYRLEIVRIVSTHNVMDWVMFGDNSSFLEMIDSTSWFTRFINLIQK